jgi:mercuric ion transport protein
MQNATLLKTGIAGSGIAAVCCATPVLSVLLAAVGLSAWVGWLDYVLLPALAFFLGLTGWALWRRQKAVACCDAASSRHVRNRLPGRGKIMVCREYWACHPAPASTRGTARRSAGL